MLLNAIRMPSGLYLLLITLKSFKLTSLSWWLVLAPVWVGVAAIAFSILICFLYLILKIMTMTETRHTICPHCKHIWSIDEIEYQSCDNCGFPLHEELKETVKEKEFDFTKYEYLH